MTVGGRIAQDAPQGAQERAARFGRVRTRPNPANATAGGFRAFGAGAAGSRRNGITANPSERLPPVLRYGVAWRRLSALWRRLASLKRANRNRNRNRNILPETRNAHTRAHAHTRGAGLFGFVSVSAFCQMPVFGFGGDCRNGSRTRDRRHGAQERHRARRQIGTGANPSERRERHGGRLWRVWRESVGVTVGAFSENTPLHVSRRVCYNLRRCGNWEVVSPCRNEKIRGKLKTISRTLNAYGYRAVLTTVHCAGFLCSNGSCKP